MTKNLINEIVALVRGGWRPYTERPEGYVYKKLGCEQAGKKGDKPYWFYRGDLYLCIGCARRCSLSRPEGFRPPLPILYKENPEHPYLLTPEEMVQKRSLLLVPEASYCLNVKERTIYAWIYEGVLRVTKRRPRRIPVEDVRALMNEFEE